MPDLGIRLQLLLGPTIPLPASYAVMDALVDLEVYNNDTELDAFRMTFTIGKESPLDYGLLTNGYFDPPSRVVIIVLVNAQPQVLIDGIITHHQVISGRQPGQSRLIVTGDDFTKKLDLEPKSATFPNQSDSAIVTQLLENYDGLVPEDGNDRHAGGDRSRPEPAGDRSRLHSAAGKTERLRFLYRAD
jgi:hypothetical protein